MRNKWCNETWGKPFVLLYYHFPLPRQMSLASKPKDRRVPLLPDSSVKYLNDLFSSPKNPTPIHTSRFNLRVPSTFPGLTHLENGQDPSLSLTGWLTDDRWTV